jgi:release factor glutamine methyltransferase
MNLSSRLRRARHAILYHAYVKRKLSRRDTVRMFGLRLEVPPSVFHPALFFTSRYFARYLNTLDLAGKRGIEVGSGSGMLSLVAARRGARMIALEINPAAVASTSENARANGLEHLVSVLQSDLFSSLPEGISDADFILCNPPYYEGIPEDDADRAWRGGHEFGFLRRLAADAGAHLREDGTIIMVLSTDAEIPKIITLFQAAGYRTAVTRQKRLLFEMLMIIEARREAKPCI